MNRIFQRRAFEKTVMFNVSVVKKTVLIVVGSLFSVLYLGAVLPFAGFFGVMAWHMRAGSRYMDSLSESDIKAWIARSAALLDYRDTTNAQDIRVLRGADIPAELRDLGIKRIDVLLYVDIVRYMWVGGLDHTGLVIIRLKNGDFQVGAQYNDDNYEQIWPRQEDANKTD